MAQPIFRPYTQGIQPVRGQMEAGQFIGQAMANALSSFGGDIAKGFEGYTKNKMVAEGAIAKAGSMKGQFDALYNSISGMPEFQSVADALKKQGDALAKTPSMSTPQALAEIEGANAFLQSFPTIMQLTQAQAAYKARNAVREGMQSEGMPQGGYQEIPIALPEGEASFDPTKPLVPQLKQLDEIVAQAASSGVEVKPYTARKNYIAGIRAALQKNTTLAPQIRTNVIAQLDAYERSEERFDQFLFPEVYGDDLLSTEQGPVEAGPPLFNPDPLLNPTGQNTSMSPQEAMTRNPNQPYIASSGRSLTAYPRDSWLNLARRAGIDTNDNRAFDAFIEQSGYPRNHVFTGGEVIGVPSTGGLTSEQVRGRQQERMIRAGNVEAQEPLFNPAFTIEPEQTPLFNPSVTLPDVPVEPQAPVAQAPAEPPPVVINAPVTARIQRPAPSVSPAPSQAPVSEPTAEPEMGSLAAPEGGFGGFGVTQEQAREPLPQAPEGGFGGFGLPDVNAGVVPEPVGEFAQTTPAQRNSAGSLGFDDLEGYLAADAADQAAIKKPAVGEGNEYDNMAQALSKVTDPAKRAEAEKSFAKYWVERSNAVGAGPKGNKVLPPSMQMSTGKYIELLRAGKSDKEIKEMVEMSEKLYLGQGIGEQINEAVKAGDVEKLEALRAQMEESEENWLGVGLGLGLVGADIFFRSRGAMNKALPQLQQAAAVPQAERAAAVRGTVEQLELDLGASAGPRAGRTAAEVQGTAGTRFRAFVPNGRTGGTNAGAASATAQAAASTTAGSKILKVAGKVGKFGSNALSIINAGNFLYEMGLLTKVGFGNYEENRQKYLSGNLGAFGFKGLFGMVDMAMGPNLEELRAQQTQGQEMAGNIAGAYRERFSEQTGYKGVEDIKPITLGEIDIAVAREFKAADRAEQERYLRDFVVNKLGYMPMDYEDVKATFMPDQPQFVETEYGTFYKGGKDGQWQPYKTQTASIQDIRKEYTGVYGTPDGRGRFTPIRLEGGISLSGIYKGTDGMLKDFDAGVRLAAQARTALASLKKLVADNPVGKSLSPTLRAEATALINRIKPAIRTDIIGVGTVSNYEQSILESSIQNPSNFFTFDNASLRQIELLEQQFDTGLRNQARLSGVEISLSDPLGLDRKQQVREAKARRRANQSPQ